jgi:effector-binding domain-containing protein
VSAQVGPAGIGEIETREVSGSITFALTTRGPYWRLSGAFARIRGMMAEAGLKAIGAPFGLFYDDPGKTAPEETRYSICYPLAEADRGAALAASGLAAAHGPAQAALSAPESGDFASVIEFPSGLIATVEYRGPAAESPAVYERLETWVQEHGFEPDGPPREVYLAVPGSLGGGQMHAEVQQPIRRVGAHED